MTNYCSLIHIFVLLLFCTSCAVGPNYKTPEINTNNNFKGDIFKSSANVYIPDEYWWQSFNDPILDSLILNAVKNNLEIKQSLAAVKSARQLRDGAFLELWPGLQIAGSYDKGRGSAVRFPTGESGENAPNFNYRSYQGSVDAAWELDFFGGLRKELEAAEAEFGGSVARLADVLRIVISDIALNYFLLSSSSQQILLTQESIKLNEDSVKVAEAKYDTGLFSALDLEQAKSELETVKSTLPIYKDAFQVALNRLAVLSGESPSDIIVSDDTIMSIPEYKGEPTISDAATLLRQRPDIRIAERQLAAETAKIGVAIAEYFPKITFNGSIGLEVPSTSLISSDARTNSFGPSITWTPFDLGRLRAKLKSQRARTLESFYNYQKVSLEAIEEVENALSRHKAERDRYQSLKAAADSSRKAFNIAKLQYQEGATDLLTVLVNQSKLIENEREVIENKLDLASSIVGIYKAFGGGWQKLMPEEELIDSSTLSD